MNSRLTASCALICRKYELEDDTIEFIGHALALHFSDEYLDKPAVTFVKRMKVERFNKVAVYIVLLYNTMIK